MESRAILLLLTLASPSLGYSAYPRAYGGGRLQDAGLGEYLGGYAEGYAGDEQYGVPDYQPSPRYTYAAPQRPRINKEAMAALLSAAIDDYMDYDTYSDDDGTWYDDFATPDVAQPVMPSEDGSLMQRFFNPRPARYSLEDLENLERTAAREDNTENQLHELTRKQPQLNKKSVMPVLGGRVAGSPMLKKGQKEEMFDIPATSVRRPVFARAISTCVLDKPKEEQQPIEDSQTSSSQTSTQKPEETKRTATDSSTTTTTNSNSEATVSSSNSSSSSSNTATVSVPRAAETPYLKDRYETLRSFLDRERKARQERDQKQRRAPHKRFITEQEALTQQLSSLKKTVA